MVKKFRTLLLPLLGLLFLPSLVFAQNASVEDASLLLVPETEESAGKIVSKIDHVEGSRFIITTGEKSKTYDILLGDWTNLLLETGQTLVTDSGTFLELTFNGADGIKAKLGENSMLSFISREDNSYIIKMHYGRMRIRTEPTVSGDLPSWPVGKEGIWITGNEVAAFWQRGDMGYEIFYKRDSLEPVYKTSVYAFAGQVTLFYQNIGANNKVERISREQKILTGDKMVSYRTGDEWIGVSMLPEIEPEVTTFWLVNQFSAPSAPSIPLVDEIPVVSPPPPIVVQQPVEEPLAVSNELKLDLDLERKRRSSSLAGKTFFTTGVGLLVGSMIIRTLVPVNSDSSSINEIMLLSSFIAGGVFSTAGVGLLTYSSLLK